MKRKWFFNIDSDSEPFWTYRKSWFYSFIEGMYCGPFKTKNKALEARKKLKSKIPNQ